MNQALEPTIRVHVDPTNPGQFFACCGLLEIADRIWGGAEGWFEGEGFALRSCIADSLADAKDMRLTNVIPKLCFESLDPGDEYSPPLALRASIEIRLDWWKDDQAGGSRLKTWAGQQKVINIAEGMKREAEAMLSRPSWEWLQHRDDSSELPFNFDSDLGGMGSDRDLGFSMDPLKMKATTRPMVELMAFIGLQRFRPAKLENENRYRFSTWSDPLVPEIASIAACGMLEGPRLQTYEFRLLYRTKYLKSFLPANPIGGDQ
ncbi:MAG: type I-U CRISPR-associated protein Cas8c [Myxococcales bacterium]|nr:MAG: type I-U CRISPR-associated protein Cas8c [Myxococcales bacterium]